MHLVVRAADRLHVPFHHLVRELLAEALAEVFLDLDVRHHFAADFREAVEPPGERNETRLVNRADVAGVIPAFANDLVSLLALVVVALQLACALFFVGQIAASVLGLPIGPIAWAYYELIEIGAAVGLIMGSVFGALALRRARQRSHEAEAALKRAQSAFKDVLEMRFKDWDLTAAERKRGVVAFSSGNHGQAIAAAGRRLGVPTVVVMPEDAPAVKLERTRAQGAEVVTYDPAAERRETIAARIAEAFAKSGSDAAVVSGIEELLKETAVSQPVVAGVGE